MKRQWVRVPVELVKGSIDVTTALEWCTDEVLRLDEENQRLREKLAAHEGVPTLQSP